jgi:hypothetical protein
MSHMSPDFVPVFGECIRMVREVLFTKDSQPFLIAGSGTLGWDQVSDKFVSRIQFSLCPLGGLQSRRTGRERSCSSQWLLWRQLRGLVRTQLFPPRNHRLIAAQAYKPMVLMWTK